MSEYKTTWFFEGIQRNTGITASSIVSWTETWYQTNNSVDQALTKAIDIGPNTWIRRRLGFLHALYQIKWARVSDTVNPRLTKTAPVPGDPQGQLGAPGGGRIMGDEIAEGTAAQVNCAVLVDFTAMPVEANDRTHHRRVLLRGLGTSMIRGNVMSEVGAGWNALRAFCNYIGQGQAPQPGGGVLGTWLIRIQNPAQSFVRLNPVNGLVVNPDNKRLISVTAALPAALKDRKIQLRGVVTPRGANRVWTVLQDAAAGGPYLLGKSRFNLEGVWDLTGQANLVTNLYRAPAQYVIVGLRDKHTGSSPFGRTRGRRRAG